MAARSNALSELTRFWLEARHGCLVTESVPVAVKYGSSDIDLVALRPTLEAFRLPTGVAVGPRLIVETKDEHDWEPSGSEFGAYIQADISRIEHQRFIPKDVKGVKFSMLRQQHFDKAVAIFGSDDFDRLFVVHAVDPNTRSQLLSEATGPNRIHLLTVKELASDLVAWYKAHPRPSTLRNSLIGDLVHLLVGYCGLSPIVQQSSSSESSFC